MQFTDYKNPLLRGAIFEIGSLLLTIPHEGEVLHLERSVADPNTWLVKDPKDALKRVEGST